MNINRRELLGASLGLGCLDAQSILAQQPVVGQPTNQMTFPARRGAPPLPSRKGKISKLFKSPEGYPNGIALGPNGWWLGEQKTDHAILVDWDGRLLKTVKTESKNTSGIAFGDDYIWMAANSTPEGIFQTDMDSKTVRHLQIPLGGANGGGCHGALYQDGKLWVAALRLRGILRVDVKSWEPEYMIPYAVPRAHGIAWDNGTIWMVTGNAEGKSGLIRYDASTGHPLETIEFDELYPDPHGLAMRNGVMYTCDAGLHPGWQDDISPAHGYVCRIDF